MKRVFDFLLSLTLFIIFGPLMLALVILIRATSKGPAVFWSNRVGINNKIFPMPKFRSMYIDTPQVATHLLKDSQSHITPVGKFLRKTSLDELPQLWSILIGNMSFVGPRPALYNQDNLVEMRTAVGVHTLIPGLTGWAQINGRDEIPLDVKVNLDKEYLDRKSFFFDIYIMWMTFVKVILRKDISH